MNVSVVMVLVKGCPDETICTAVRVLVVALCTKRTRSLGFHAWTLRQKLIVELQQADLGLLKRLLKEAL